jgi:hypothetical protein
MYLSTWISWQRFELPRYEYLNFEVETSKKRLPRAFLPHAFLPPVNVLFRGERHKKYEPIRDKKFSCWQQD